METKKLILAGGLVVGGLALMQVLPMLSPPQIVEREVPAAPVAAVVEHEKVLFANANVTRGSRLSADVLEWRQWPKESVTTNMIVKETRAQAMDELAGSVVRTDIFSGEPLIEAKLVRAGESGLMAALLSPGMRAVTTRVSVDSAAGGFILPGDRVDIIHTMQVPRRRDDQTQTNQTQYSASTIFTDVKVLAMNQMYAAGPESPASVSAPSFATFELNQRDAERLEMAAKTGSISLTLRGLSSGGVGRSAATTPPEPEAAPTSRLVVYRNGQQTQAAVRGQ